LLSRDLRKAICEKPRERNREALEEQFRHVWDSSESMRRDAPPQRPMKMAGDEAKEIEIRTCDYYYEDPRNRLQLSQDPARQWQIKLQSSIVGELAKYRATSCFLIRACHFLRELEVLSYAPD
jgi:hypothetical protein